MVRKPISILDRQKSSFNQYIKSANKTLGENDINYAISFAVFAAQSFGSISTLLQNKKSFNLQCEEEFGDDEFNEMEENLWNIINKLKQYSK